MKRLARWWVRVVLDALLGPEDEFTYRSTTDPPEAPRD